MLRLAGSDFMLLYFKAPSRHLWKMSDQTVTVLGLAHAPVSLEPALQKSAQAATLFILTDVLITSVLEIY